MTSARPLPERAHAAEAIGLAILPSPSAAQRAGRRSLDLVVGAVSLLLLGVPMLLLAAAVKLTSAGPALFVQERVGRDGERFNVYKFRTMRDGTHADVLADEQQRMEYRRNGFKLRPDDPRITRVGRFLRKTSLDELPQLINVMRGQMSIVGVRPLLVEELALRPQYHQDLYRLLRPGMTGLWQVEGRSTVGEADRLELDAQYVREWTLRSDIKILLRTPMALLRTSHAH